MTVEAVLAPLPALAADSIVPDEISTRVISTRKVDGHIVVLSRYGDAMWLLPGRPTNATPSDNYADFGTVSERWRPTMKAILWRYMQRGREGKKKPGARVVLKLLGDARPFLAHLDKLGITRLRDVTPFACSLYVEVCRAHRLADNQKRRGQALKPASLVHRLAVVEALHELSQHIGDTMPMHPWPGTSATHLSGISRAGIAAPAGQTPLMPDDVFTSLFQHAWRWVETAAELLDVRDELLMLRDAAEGRSRAEYFFVRSRGWADQFEFNKAVLTLRTACYIVVASLSGCRNHELAFVQRGACYSTEASVGNEETGTFWWMRSQSTKTGEGRTEWMVPQAVVTALEVMERWSAPFRRAIESEIAERRQANPLDPEIAEAQEHIDAVFLSMAPGNENQVRTISLQGMNMSLKAFAKDCGIDWDLASHHFRRKFANYAARSQFGDLRYLRAHFKHWSMDMTLGYALNASQELALYAEIELELDGIKEDVVASWVKPGTPLAGGYGRNIVAWRGSHAVTIFRDQQQMVRSLAESTAIRSNGHAWCTAEDNRCVGNELERTRCSGCDNGVIGPEHEPVYRGLHDHLQEVLDCDDIGRGGQRLVQRDMQRCQEALDDLARGCSEAAAA